MSKEMLIIVLGVWTIVLTQLGIPYHPWGVILYVLTGIAIAVTGFLLRGEALSRLPHDSRTMSRAHHITFAESAPQAVSQNYDQEGVGSSN